MEHNSRADTKTINPPVLPGKAFQASNLCSLREITGDTHKDGLHHNVTSLDLYSLRYTAWGHADFELSI